MKPGGGVSGPLRRGRTTPVAREEPIRRRASTMVFNGPVDLTGSVIGSGVTVLTTRGADGRTINRVYGAYSPDIVTGDFIVYDGSSVPRVQKGPASRGTAAIVYPEEPDGGDPKLTEDHPRLCTLCLEREKRVAIVPCGHLYACFTCIRTSKPTTCAQCRKALTGFIRVFDA